MEEQLARWLERCAPVVVLSGAGLSTASGVGDYRDREGRWKLPPPVTLQDFMATVVGRQRYWLRSMRGWPQFRLAEPNAGHLALAEAERVGQVQGVITQNVDGLHQAAGSRAVIDLHGRNSRVICTACEWQSSRDAVQEQLLLTNPGWLDRPVDADRCDAVELRDFVVPLCPRCGAIVRPDVVFFGDNVPRERVDLGRDWVEAGGGLLVVGSSLTVFSGFRFCRQAAQIGRPIAIVNRGQTRGDALAELVLDGDVTDLLQALFPDAPADARP